MPTFVYDLVSTSCFDSFRPLGLRVLLISVACAFQFPTLLFDITQDHSVSLTYIVVHHLFLKPFIFSPLRSVPGPPLGHPIIGQLMAIVRGESCIPHREWVKQYGPVVRVVGPFGIELLVFMRPEALNQILVKGWLDYPRVRSKFYRS